MTSSQMMGLRVIIRHVTIFYLNCAHHILFTDLLFCVCSSQGSCKTWALFVIAEFAKVTRCVNENMLITCEGSYFFFLSQ